MEWKNISNKVRKGDKDMTYPRFVKPMQFEEYKEKYKGHFLMERNDGIIMLRMHTNGGPVVWTVEKHRTIHQALRDVGADPENEVLIFTGTGKYFIAFMGRMGGKTPDTEYDESDPEKRKWGTYNVQYADGTKIVENLIFDLEIPTIGVINGPGFHAEMLLLCDVTICTEDTIILDPHMKAGLVSGDGFHCALQGLLNTKRATYAMLTSQPIDANKALEWGLVNEVVPKERIYERAWELGREFMKFDRYQRRLMVHIMRKPWKRRIVEDLRDGFAHEMFSFLVTHAAHDPDNRKRLLRSAGIDVEDR